MFDVTSKMKFWAKFCKHSGEQSAWEVTSVFFTSELSGGDQFHWNISTASRHI